MINTPNNNTFKLLEDPKFSIKTASVFQTKLAKGLKQAKISQLPMIKLKKNRSFKTILEIVQCVNLRTFERKFGLK